MAIDVEARFWSKVDKTGECWLWAAGRDKDGYGIFSIARRSLRAHRVAYELLVGPIPQGLVIDHLCRNEPCVNPEHLEPVTVRENGMRGDTFQARNAAKTHCIRGHEFTSENTWIDPARGVRKCKACHREQNRPSEARARAEGRRPYKPRCKAHGCRRMARMSGACDSHAPGRVSGGAEA